MNKHIRKLLGLLQHGKQIQQASPTHQRPPLKTPEEWQTYWKSQGQPWRTQPEIDGERQDYLANRRLIPPNIEQGIYPFKDIEPKLTRADIEWLLATHENGRGPVDWSDERQREREGLDVRGADLCQEDLSSLPLACLCGGLLWNKDGFATQEQSDMAAALLEGANLTAAHLEGATLYGVHMEGAELHKTHLDGAKLWWAHLERADLTPTYLEGAVLIGAHLERASLMGSSLQRANLEGAHLEGTILYGAHLERANLGGAHLEGADLQRAYMEGAELTYVTMSDEKHVGPMLVDIHWGDTNLATVNWAPVKMLRDEREARQKNDLDGKAKDRDQRLAEYEIAVRAYRQLATVLRNQGLNEDAARFAFRAQKLQRVVLRRQRKFGQYLFSLFLDVLAGYGYRPGRSIVAYLVIIFGFMGLYLLNSHIATPHLRWDEALVLSVSSFHGRGFFSQDITLGDTYARLAATEAVVGLLIEISFIATFTQRFFGK